MVETITGRQRTLARAISIVSNPALITLAAIFYTASLLAPDRSRFWIWSWLAIGLILSPGLLYGFWTLVKKRHFDLEIGKRQDRIVPLLLSSLGALIGSYLVSSRLEVGVLSILSTALAMMLISLTIITLVWKISLHTATAASYITLIVLFGGWAFTVCYLILLPIGWSRFVLNQHTLAQIIGGALAAIGVTSVAWLMFAARI